VVIGSSFISMELVVAVAKKELASIDVVGRGSVPFEAILGTQIGNGLMNVRADLHQFSCVLSNRDAVP
jgi:hypothetical protein